MLDPLAVAAEELCDAEFPLVMLDEEVGSDLAGLSKAELGRLPAN